MKTDSSPSPLNFNRERSQRFLQLGLVSLLPILALGHIKVKTMDYDFLCWGEESVPYSFATAACMVPITSTIIEKGEPIFGKPETPPVSHRLAVKFYHGDVPYHTTTLRDLLWSELVAEPQKTSIKDEDGTEVQIYENVTMSGALPDEESILSCIFDMLLLHADAQANGFKMKLEWRHWSYFNIHPKSSVCYLPPLVYSAQKALHGYITTRNSTNEEAKILNENNIWGAGMAEMAEFVLNICQLTKDLIPSIKKLRCRDPRFELLYEMLLHHSYLTTVSFLDIASLVSVFPDLPLAKKKQWLRYLEYRGYKDATKAENPVVAFVDGVVHPFFSYFAPHAVLEEGNKEGKENVNRGIMPEMETSQSEKAGAESEQTKGVLTVPSEREDGARDKLTMPPSIETIMGVTDPYHLGKGEIHLLGGFKMRKPLESFNNVSSLSLQARRDQFKSEKHEKQIKRNFFTRTRKRADGTADKKAEGTDGTAEIKAEETAEKGPTNSKYTVISLPLYSWRTAQDNVLDEKSREEILSTLTQIVKEKSHKFSTEFAKCNMDGYKGDPTIILQFLGEVNPASRPTYHYKALLSHEKRTSLVTAVRASYHFMKKRNPSSHKKFLTVHPLVLKAFIDENKGNLNTFILANCKDDNNALHIALDAAVTFYLTFLHFIFYDEMRAFDHSSIQLMKRREAIKTDLFNDYRFYLRVKSLPLVSLSVTQLLPIAAKVNVFRGITNGLVESLSKLSSQITKLEIPKYKTWNEGNYRVVNEEYKKKDFIRETMTKEKSILKARSIIQKKVAEYLKNTDLRGMWNYLVDKTSFQMKFDSPSVYDLKGKAYNEAIEALLVLLPKYPGLKKYSSVQLMSILHFLSQHSTYCARLELRDLQERYWRSEHLFTVEAQDEAFLAKLTSLRPDQVTDPIFLLKSREIINGVKFEKLEVEVSYDNLNNDISDFCSLLKEKDISSYWKKANNYLNSLIQLMSENSNNKLAYYVPQLVAEVIQWLEILKVFVDDAGMVSNF